MPRKNRNVRTRNRSPYKPKGKKRPRSWHRGENRDREYLGALEQAGLA